MNECISRAKVQELPLAQLDCWAGKADGKDVRIIRSVFGTERVEIAGTPFIYAPSTNWEHGGPIIEREIKSMHCDGGKMMAIAHDGTPGWGATYLEAAMRAYVASKFGSEVEDIQHEPTTTS